MLQYYEVGVMILHSECFMQGFCFFRHASVVQSSRSTYILVVVVVEGVEVWIVTRSFPNTPEKGKKYIVDMDFLFWSAYSWPQILDRSK